MNTIFKILSSTEEADQTCHKTVVRLKTSMWHDGNGFYAKKAILLLKRRSCWPILISEDCDCAGAMESISRVENLYSVPDGIYELATVNEYRDRESGCIEDWDYRLVPVE